MYNTTTIDLATTATTIQAAEAEVTLSLKAAASLALPVDALRLSRRKINILQRHNINVVAQLVAIPEEELSRYKGVGRAMLWALRSALAQYDLRLGILPSFRRQTANEDIQALIAGNIDVYCDDDE